MFVDALSHAIPNASYLREALWVLVQVNKMRRKKLRLQIQYGGGHADTVRLPEATVNTPEMLLWMLKSDLSRSFFS